jgi:hypothetical protein
MDAHMIALRCLIRLVMSGADPGFRTSSPRHENGFVGAANGFVERRCMKQVHASAVGSPAQGRALRVIASAAAQPLSHCRNLSSTRQPANPGLTSGLPRVTEGMSAICVCDRGSEPTGLNHRLSLPAHPRHDLPAVMFVARHDRLVVTVSKREPSLFGPSGGFLVGGPE